VRPIGTETALSSKIIRNVIASGVRILLVAPVPFIVTPIIVHNLGTAGYGSWAVFLGISSLTTMADLGMVGAFSKHVAEYYARRDFDSLSRLLSTGMFIFVLLAAALGGVAWFAAPLIARLLFRGSPFQATEIAFLMRCYVVLVVANILTLLYSSVVAGLQRLDLASYASTLNIYFTAFTGVTLLLHGWGLRGLVYGQVSASVLVLAAYMILLSMLLPSVRISMELIDIGEAKKLFHFSSRLYLTQTAMAVHNQLEKFLLALFTGVAAAGWYDIASDVAIKLRSLIGFVLGPVLPAASELDALQDERRLKDLYFRSQKYLAFIAFPLVSFVVAVADRFVVLWLGPGFAFLGLPLAVLVCIHFFNVTTGPAFFLSAGIGNLMPAVKSAIFGVILNITLSVFLIYKFGFAGAVIGTGVSLTAAAAYFMYLFHQGTTFSMFRVLRECYLKPACISAILGVVVHLIINREQPSWAGMVLLGIGSALTYIAALLSSAFFDEYDLIKAERFVPGARYARRIIRVA